MKRLTSLLSVMLCCLLLTPTGCLAGAKPKPVPAAVKKKVVKLWHEGRARKDLILDVESLAREKQQLRIISQEQRCIISILEAKCGRCYQECLVCKPRTQ